MTNASFSLLTLFGRSGRRTGFVKRMIDADARYRQTVQLSQLDSHMLDDIGLSDDSRPRSAQRPVWNAPGHWRN